MKLHRNIKTFINYFLGPLLFIWLSWSIYHQIVRQPDLGTAWNRIKASFQGPMVWNLAITLLLMLLNWFIEAVKWKISVRDVQQVSYTRAFKAVLSGVSFSVSTPNRIGEYAGRVMYMNEGNRLKTVSITIVGSISQLIITLVMGLAGVLLMLDEITGRQVISPMWLYVVIYGLIATILILTVFYFRVSWLASWIEKLPGAKRFVYLVEALERFDATLLLKLLSLSLLRYFVFVVQYYLVFQLFDVPVNAWQTLWAVSVSFMILAAIPTITILELVQRGKVVAAVVGLYSANELGMNLATASIWFVNLMLPAIAGSILILQMKRIITLRDETG